MSVTLDDVAQASGVSRATASRALNGNAKVSEATRRRVRAAADSLGYRVNEAARALAKGHTDVLGLVLPPGGPDIDIFQASLVGLLTEAASSRGKAIMLRTAGVDTGPVDLDRVFNGGFVDGLLVMAQAFGTPWVDELLVRDLPVVAVGSHPQPGTKYRVHADNYRGAVLATQHLIDLGHTKLATITGNLEHEYGRSRLAGFRDTVTKAGLDLPDHMVRRGDFDFYQGQAAMEQLLPHEPTAVFVASDQMAAGAYSASRRVGLTIPQDLSIVGFDNVPWSAKLPPPLTTIAQHPKQIAEAAVDLLLAVLDGQHEAAHLLCDVSLVERSSTARVPD